jgi:hypothetical protein
MEDLSNISRDDVKRAWNRFCLRLEEIVAAKDDFIFKISSIYPNKQLQNVSSLYIY